MSTSLNLVNLALQDKNFKQKDLANHLGITTTAMNNIFKNKVKLKADDFLSIMKLCGHDFKDQIVNEYLGDHPKNINYKKISQLTSNLFKSLEPHIFRQLLEMITTFTNASRESKAHQLSKKLLTEIKKIES